MNKKGGKSLNSIKLNSFKNNQLQNKSKKVNKVNKVDDVDDVDEVDNVEGRVDDVEGRVDDVEGRVDDVNKVDDVEGRVDDVEGRVDDVEGRVDDVDKVDYVNKVDDVDEVEKNKQLESIKEKVIEINNNLQKLKNNFDNKVDIKLNSEKLNKSIEKLNNTTNYSIPIIRDIHLNKDKLFDKIGILDPEGLENNPLTGEPYQNGLTYKDYAKSWSNYPMYEQRENVINTVYNNQCILITAGTGSGKTVLVPKYTLHALNYQAKIAITIPRKAATIKAADFAAKTLDVKLGEHVGYMVKDDKQTSDSTNLVYATDGYILSIIKNKDPLLSEFDCLIIDEAHERNTNIDLLLLLVKNILKNRPNFKLIIMSATIDPKIFLNYYEEFGIKYIEGVSKPNKNIIEIFLEVGKEVNRKAPNGEILGGRPAPFILKAVDIIFNDIIKANKPGDILVLLPGKSDCLEACMQLDILINKEKKSNKEFAEKPFCIQLDSFSKKKTFRNATEQNYAIGNKDYKQFVEKYTRRIVMATEVAESSLTFSGEPIDWVIDSGLSNKPTFYPDTHLNALEKRYIAEANHTQRKGRTGRLREGTCYNIFTEAEYKQFLKYPIAPIMTSDITKEILSFLSMPNITHIDIPFQYPELKKNVSKNLGTLKSEALNIFLKRLIEPPHIEYVNYSINKLYLLGALTIEDKKAFLNPFGFAINSFRDIDPPKAACIVHSYNYKCSNQVIELMALLHGLEDDFGDIINQPKTRKNDPGSKEKEEDFKRKMNKITSSYGDHITLHNMLETYKEKTYDVSWDRGKQVLTSKGTGEMGAGTMWAKDNYIKPKKLSEAFKLSKDLNHSLGQIIGNYKRDNPEKSENRFIFTDTVPILHDRMDDNIMHVITLGYLNNVAKKTGKLYSTCFPDVKIFANIDRLSSFNYIKIKPINCIFSKSFSLFGMKKFQTFSKIPIKVLESLNKKINIIKCIKSTENKNKNKNKNKNNKHK
jgi:HrpA-like RNA helicase